MSSRVRGKPQTYVRPVPMNWFAAKQSYTLFILRELSAAFVGVVVLLQLNLVWATGQGRTAFQAALDWYTNPLVVLFHLVALGFVILHAVTWFKLNAHIMELRMGEKVMPQAYMIGSEYIGWILGSALIFWWVVL